MHQGMTSGSPPLSKSPSLTVGKGASRFDSNILLGFTSGLMDANKFCSKKTCNDQQHVPVCTPFICWNTSSAFESRPINCSRFSTSGLSDPSGILLTSTNIRISLYCFIFTFPSIMRIGNKQIRGFLSLDNFQGKRIVLFTCFASCRLQQRTQGLLWMQRYFPCTP